MEISIVKFHETGFICVTVSLILTGGKSGFYLQVLIQQVLFMTYIYIYIYIYIYNNVASNSNE